MKKFLLLFYTLFTITLLKAQEPADALRYSWIVPSGTARQQAIGGAMGSLGGDITATFINPAGLGFYRTGDVVLTPQYMFGKNKANYFNRDTFNKNSRFALGASGFVIGDGSDSKKIKSTAFSIALNRMADFNSNITYLGTNNKSSFSQKYLEEIALNNDKDANVVSSSIDPNDPRFRPNYVYGTSLAFNTYWIDTIGGSTNGNFKFQTRSPIASGLYQMSNINSKGSMNEFALGVGANLNNKLMIGGSIGIPFIHYERTTEFLEVNPDTTGSKFDYALFSDKLVTRGTGINLKAGLIYKPAEFWRLGLAIHSPSFIKMTDSYEAVISARTKQGNGWGTLVQDSKLFTNNEPSEYKYIMITPYRVVGSISYVFREIQDVTKQRGFVTADIEYVNYKASSYIDDPDNNSDQGTKDYLKQLNKAISNYYRGAFNFRVGGELKFTIMMVRAGAAYYSNPYQDTYGEHGSKLNFSGGIGYRNKGMFMDLTYVHSINKDVNLPYRLQSSPNYGAAIATTNGTVLATVGFKF
ncbi:MAG: hypothetical protein C4329_02550 [Chitinophagaceae bacterium]